MKNENKKITICISSLYDSQKKNKIKNKKLIKKMSHSDNKSE